MNKGITVKQLAAYCRKAIANGNGDKRILISSDDEGNEYHELFYQFTPSNEIFSGSKYDGSLPFGVSYDDAVKDYIVLG